MESFHNGAAEMKLNDRPYLRRVELSRSLDIDRSSYPFNIPSICTLDFLDFHPDVTFFIGENGAGKSTLIEAIAIALGFNPEGGTKNSLFSTKSSHSELYKYLKTIKSFKHPEDGYFLRAESFYNLATLMDEVGYLKMYGGKSLHLQSHGESFMTTLTNKLQGDGLYIMDEPEAALSPIRQMAALTAINKLVENNSQFIIATHSPILLAYPKSKIYLFSDIGISEITYEETEHYIVYKDFLNNHEKMLKHLMDN